MAADLTAKKADYLTKLVTFADQLLAVTRAADELHAYALANGLLTGGAAPVTDPDCTGANAHLTAALVNAVDTLASQLSGAVTAAMRNTLRQADSVPQS